MDRIELSDGEWWRLLAKLKTLPGIHIGLPDTCRQFNSACLWILRSGSQWRVLPPAQGKWISIFKRFSRWCANGTWEKLHCHFTEEADLQDVSMDGTVIRALSLRELLDANLDDGTLPLILRYPICQPRIYNLMANEFPIRL